MARVLVTGSTDGLGRAAARTLIDEGHQVVLHARSRERASALDDLASRSAGVVVGDLGSAVETRSVAEQVNAIGRMDAVIHNAGISSTKGRSPTPEGHATILAVNTLAPYMLTALIERPRRSCTSVAACTAAARLVARHRLDRAALELQSGVFRQQALCHRTRLRGRAALARRAEQCRRSRLGGDEDGWAGSARRFDKGYLTQTWLAVSDDPAATVSGHIGITADPDPGQGSV